MRCDRLLVRQNNRRDLHEHRLPPDRDIVHLFGRDATSPESSVSAAVRWDIRKLVAQSRIQRYRSSHRVGTCSRMINYSGTPIPHRETPFRPGPHLDRNTAESTGASRTQTTDSLTIPDQADTEPVETTQTGSLMDRPDSPYTDHVDDSVLQISGAGHWFLEGWIGDHSVELLVDSGSSVTAMSDSLYQTLVQAGHRWERWDILQVLYAVQTGLGLECRDALTAWCHSLHYRRSFPYSFATWPRVQMPL